LKQIGSKQCALLVFNVRIYHDAVQQNIKFKQPVLSRPTHLSLTIRDMVFASI